MKTLVLGYKTVDGSGPAEVLAGPEVPRNEAWDILLKGKAQKYPKGIKRIEFYRLEMADLAIAIEVKVTPEPTKTKTK